MSKNLVIVESPAKAKTIEKYLGADYKVLASVGHIRKDVKVDVHDNFAVTYEIDPDHKNIISELKKEAKKAESIWLATDEDREGESISWHLLEVLKLPKSTHRITFHEITKTALQSAIANPRTVDMDMVSSQQARQTLDMLVGYDLSDIVRKKVPGAKSAGRVQSPALRLIVEKEREIEKFSAKSTFKVTGKFSNQVANISDPNSSEIFDASLEKSTIQTPDEVKNLFSQLADSDFIVQNVEQTEGTKANPVPFTTAALQIESNSRLGYSAKATMSAAQGLYQAGLITYHRTDSLNLSKDAISAISSYIKQTFGENYLQVRHFHTKDASAQEAHEAIRPTNIAQEVAGKNDYEKKLYQLIRTRTLATQMKNAVVAKTNIDIIPSTNPDLHFNAKGEVVIFDGFLKVYGKNKDTLLPQLNVGDLLNTHDLIAKQTYSKPPARYTEGSLVKKLEELGIGRPSTYAPTITLLTSRDYVRVEKKQLIPNEIAFSMIGVLEEHFSNIVDSEFTSHLEEKLDEIALDKADWQKVLSDFYYPFMEKISAGKTGIKSLKTATLIGEKCPECGSELVLRKGRYGEFIACSNFPKCKYSRNVVKDNEKSAETGTTTAAKPKRELKKLDVPCPKCGGEIVERFSRRGKFYGCANYPKCDFISNYEPVAQKCDECGGDMIKKELKKGTFTECTKCKKKTLISEN